jgi:hypothetical protein
VSGWGDFAVVMGAATASLLGLLFVAVSIRVETIAKSAELRNRSAQTMTLLLTGLLAAVLLAVPRAEGWPWRRTSPRQQAPDAPRGSEGEGRDPHRARAGGSAAPFRGLKGPGDRPSPSKA